jgi:hypothetical protein
VDLNLRKKLVKCYIWSILRTADQKNLDTFEIWSLRMVENISWNDSVRNEEVLHRVKEEEYSAVG